MNEEQMADRIRWDKLPPASTPTPGDLRMSADDADVRATGVVVSSAFVRAAAVAWEATEKLLVKVEAAYVAVCADYAASEQARQRAERTRQTLVELLDEAITRLDVGDLSYLDGPGGWLARTREARDAALAQTKKPCPCGREGSLDHEDFCEEAP